MNINHLNDGGKTRLLDCMNIYSTRESAVRLGIDICKALISFRKRGVYHSVVTPKDIYVSQSGEFLLDEATGRLPEPSAELTQAVQLYIAPEAYREPESESAVIYSLGTVMYRLMNGGMEPFRETTDFLGAKVSYERRMRGLRPSAPINADASLSSIILKACEYSREQRYESIEEMLGELKQLADGNYKKKSGEKAEPSDNEKDLSFNKVPVVLGAAICGLACIGLILMCVSFRYNDIYIKAERRMRDDKFDEAKEMFEEISWYKDSDMMALKCDYRKADYLMELGMTDDALSLYNQLAKLSYEDSSRRYNEALLKKAEELKADGKTDEAMEIITLVAQGSDEEAAEALSNHKYNTAIDLFEEGKYDEAKKIFAEIGENDMAVECDYSMGIDYKDQGSYVKAMEVFKRLGDYNDSKDQFELCEEWLLMENEDSLNSYKAMEGRYSNESGRYVEYITDGSTKRARYNLPFENGAYFKLADGVHYHSKDGKSWKKQWIFEKTSSGLCAYSYVNGKAYSLERE